jgi:hypothetical protein
MWEKIRGYFKEQSQTEKKKLSEMSLKEKIEYIWEYYRLHIIAGAIVIFIAGSIINGILHPPTPRYAGIAFYEVYLDETHDKAFIDALSDGLIDDPSAYAIYTYPLVSGGDPEAQMAVTQKFMAMMMTNELDMIIADSETFPMFIYDIYYADLDQIDIQIAEELLLYGESSEDAEPRPYGVSLKNSALFKDLGLRSDDLYAGITSNSEQPERALNILKKLLAE